MFVPCIVDVAHVKRVTGSTIKVGSQMAIWTTLGNSTHFFSHELCTLAPSNAWAVLRGGDLHVTLTAAQGETVPRIYEYMSRCGRHESMSWMRFVSVYTRFTTTAAKDDTDVVTSGHDEDFDVNLSRGKKRPAFSFTAPYPASRRLSHRYRERKTAAVPSVLYGAFPSAAAMRDDAPDYKKKRELYAKAVLVTCFPWRRLADLLVPDSGGQVDLFPCLEDLYRIELDRVHGDETMISSAVAGIGSYRPEAPALFPRCELAHSFLANVEEEHHALAEEETPDDLRHLDIKAPLPGYEKDDALGVFDTEAANDSGVDLLGAAALDMSASNPPELNPAWQHEPESRRLVRDTLHSSVPKALDAGTRDAAVQRALGTKSQPLSTLGASQPFFVHKDDDDWLPLHYRRQQTTVRAITARVGRGSVDWVGMHDGHSATPAALRQNANERAALRYVPGFRHDKRVHQKLWALGPRPQWSDVSEVYSLNEDQTCAMRGLCAHLAVAVLLPLLQGEGSISDDQSRAIKADLARFLPPADHSYTTHLGTQITAKDCDQTLRMHLSGPGGAGKSHVVKAVVAWAASWSIGHTICLLATTNAGKSTTRAVSCRVCLVFIYLY